MFNQIHSNSKNVTLKMVIPIDVNFRCYLSVGYVDSPCCGEVALRLSKEIATIRFVESVDCSCGQCWWLMLRLKC